MIPFVADPDFTLYVGDVREVLAGLPEGSIDCCVTSPPYWGLRDYGTDGQIGLEATPEAFVAEMVAVFREVRRVLAPHGTLWLNLGDSYNAYNGNRGLSGSTLEGTDRPEARPRFPSGHGLSACGLKPKDLVGIPWRVAFALQADGWYLRADIIWSKPNPMPESVTDRPTKAHEYVFLLSKQPRYFFDQEAVREDYQDSNTSRFAAIVEHGGDMTSGDPVAGARHRYRLPPRPDDGRLTLDGSEGEAPRGHDGRRATNVKGADGSIQHRDGERWPNGGRNIRSVWEIATQPYPDAHFATFPEALPERCIKAGTPESVCVTCGEPRVRIVERESVRDLAEQAGTRVQSGEKFAGRQDQHLASARSGLSVSNSHNAGSPQSPKITTVGWTDCGHGNYRAGVVLDPFMGSGTTALVARRLGRKSVGIELNPEYAQLAARRLQQLSLLAEDVA